MKKLADKEYEKKDFFSANEIDEWMLENLKDEKPSKENEQKKARKNYIRNLLKIMKEDIEIFDEERRLLGNIRVFDTKKAGNATLYRIPQNMAQTELTAKLCKELADRKPFDRLSLPKEEEDKLVNELFVEYKSREGFNIHDRQDIEAKVKAAIISLYFQRTGNVIHTEKSVELPVSPEWAAELRELVPTSRVESEKKYLHFLAHPSLVLRTETD